jgi:heme-degrading monooxygenase HmoA
MADKIFSYIWEYTVKKSQKARFEQAYAPGGDWVQLFRKADGYIATDLHQDVRDPERYVTVDFWQSREHRDVFHEQYAKDFKEMDDYCENFTVSERFLGDFETFTNRF